MPELEWYKTEKEIPLTVLSYYDLLSCWRRHKVLSKKRVPSYKRHDITQYKIEIFIDFAWRMSNIIASPFRSQEQLPLMDIV